MFKDKLHPIGEWYHVAQTYDGKMFRSYVNGVLQGEAEVAFTPQGEGAASLGTRINRVQLLQGSDPPGAFHAEGVDAGRVPENQITKNEKEKKIKRNYALPGRHLLAAVFAGHHSLRAIR